MISVNPDFPAPHFWKSLIFVQIGRPKDALEELKKQLALEKTQTAAGRLIAAWTYARAGDMESARNLVEEVAKTGDFDESPSWAGMAKFALGQKDEAFALFLKACELHDSGLLYLHASPAFDEVRADPRLVDLEKRLGLPEMAPGVP